jgi:hypothetical protein
MNKLEKLEKFKNKLSEFSDWITESEELQIIDPLAKEGAVDEVINSLDEVAVLVNREIIIAKIAGTGA